MPAEQGDERRRAPRIKIFQPAEMACAGGGGARVHLLNVSTGGALVYGEAAPAVGEEVRIECGVTLGAAKVAWRSGRRFGVAFASPIAAAQVEAVLRVQDALFEAARQRIGAAFVE